MRPGSALGAAVLGSSGATFTPLDLGTSLLDWWTGRYASLITTAGGSVSALADVKNGNVLAQADAAARPVNSGIRINTDSFDDRISAESTFNLPTGVLTGGLEIWARASQTALVGDTTTRTLFSYGGAGIGASIRLNRVVDGGANRASATVGLTSGSITIPGPAVDFSGDCILRLALSTTHGTLSVNGVAGTTTAFGLAAAIGTIRTRLFAYTNNTAANFWAGGATDLLVTRPLSTDQAAQVAAFLATDTAF